MPKIPQSNTILSPEIRRYCQEKAIKLTPLREKILGIIASAEQPLTAYAILQVLQVDNPKAQVMSVYRVLGFLLENQLIHRIENLNAFTSCCHLFEKHLSQWLICQTCGHVDEQALTTFKQGIAEVEAQTGFTVTSPTIELMGTCVNCQENGEE